MAVIAQPARLAARRAAAVISIAVFISGGVLLGVEIAASRVLAPFFGSSLFVWGALIGVVLTGLAVGYWLGGMLADALPGPRLFASVMGLGAALVLLVPIVDEPVLEAIVAWNPGPRLNPLVAAVALFGLPSVVLAAVTPVAVRLRAGSIETLGRTSGRLFAISTAGSIAGTFATAFWLIPELGTNQLLAVAAATLFGAVALVSAFERLLVFLVAALAAAGAAGAFAFTLAPETGSRLSGSAAENWSPLYRLRGDAVGAPSQPEAGYRVVYAKDSSYHNIRVVEDDDTRYLRFDASFQSAMYLREPFRTRYRYTDFFGLGLAYNPDARDVLMIGLGGGSAPKRLWRDFRSLDIDVVELDPAVVDVAHRFFALPRDPRLDVIVDDGRRYLARTDRRWDVIMIDAFYSDSLPFHLTTREFVALLRERLAPGGVIVANIIGALEGSQSKLFRSMYRTYRTEFPTVTVHPVKEGESDEDLRNLMLVATEQPAPDTEFLAARWNRLRAAAPGAPDLRKPIRDRHERAIPTGDVPVLTDDYAPTDALLFVD